MTVVKRREGLWPTPQCNDLKHGMGENRQGHQIVLIHAIRDRESAAVYPTPRALSLCGGSGAYQQIKGNPNLTDDEKRALIASAGRGAKYPTPQTDHMGGGEMARKRLRKLQSDGVLSAEETRGLMMRTVGKQLNPDWEEWLMAWPVGWTDLETPNIRLVWLDPSIDPADYGEIPRVTNRRDNRPARVKEIGNGQFPLTAAVAFHWGFCVLQLVNKGAK